MGQILHGSATTTEAIRRAIQNSQESLRALSKRYGINQKTVAKWKKRTSVADLPTGPKEPHSTVLSLEEEAFIVSFRKHTFIVSSPELVVGGHSTTKRSLVVSLPLQRSLRKDSKRFRRSSGVAGEPPCRSACLISALLTLIFSSPDSAS